MSQLFDLISYSSKLSFCWFAATNERLFRKSFNSARIQKLSIEETCDEILKEIKNKPCRLKLHQASQLMYGVTKIYRDQVAKYEKDIFEVGKKLYPKMRKEIFHPAPIRDDVIDLPSPDESYLISELGNKSDLHLLQEIDGDREQAFVLSQAHLNFGALTDEQLEQMNRDESLLQAMQTRDSDRWKMDIILDDREIAEEVHLERHMSQESSSPKKRRERLLSTPQKRQPPHVQAETPTKRRRLFVGTTTDVAPPENVTAPEIHVTEAPAPLLPAEERLEDEENGRRVRRPKQLIIDKKIILSSNVMKQWQQNTHIHCWKYQTTLKLNHVNSKELFKQPVKRWATTLKIHLFDSHTIGPFSGTTEDFTLEAVQDMPEQIPEIMTSLIEQSRSVLERMHSPFVADSFADNSIAHNTLNIHPTTVNDIIQEAEEVSMIPLATESIPHMTVLEDNINIDSHQEKMTDGSRETVLLDAEKQRLLTSGDHISESSIATQQVQLTLEEILAMLEKETQSTNAEFIKFEQLIPVDKYSKERAADAFYLLLVSHAQKKIILQQEAYLCVLWICKYPVYSDSD